MSRYIKLIGLPRKATDEEIKKFLVDCDVVGNVVIINNKTGKPSGDAVVKLCNEDSFENALKCNKKYLYNRFIVIEETDSETYNKYSREIEKQCSAHQERKNLEELIRKTLAERKTKFIETDRSLKVNCGASYEEWTLKKVQDIYQI